VTHSAFLTGGRRALFLAFTARAVPAAGAPDDEARARGLALVEQLLADRPAGTRRELALFLFLVRWAPALLFFRPFDRLPPARQDAVIAWLQDAPLAKLRSGLWGLKTLAFLSYYGRPETGEAIGYRPSKDGNVFLHAR